MAKHIMQFRYYDENHSNNQPENLKLSQLVNGEVFSKYLPFTQLGIQSLPGTRFYLNDNIEGPVILGSTGIYELELEGISKISSLKFDKDGLIPAIVVDAISKKVLTLAYMNKESLKMSMEKNLTCFYSRSRQELWLKGETSKNYQHVVSITADCDKDALVVVVEPDGPACHTGEQSCFFNPVWESDERHEFSLQSLMSLIEGRKTEKKEGSYTTYLFEKGIDKILKKVGEESTEVIIAGKADDKAETVYEIADLTYHLMVLMIQMGISLEDIHKELASRHVIDHKVKQEKMTK